MQRVFKNLRRKREKNLAVLREYALSVDEKFDAVRVVCPSTRKVFKTVRRTRRNYLSAYWENAKRILLYSSYTPKRHFLPKPIIF
jgi:hypothetical protein